MLHRIWKELSITYASQDLKSDSNLVLEEDKISIF
jgi:hypothetical protein